MFKSIKRFFARLAAKRELNSLIRRNDELLADMRSTKDINEWKRLTVISAAYTGRMFELKSKYRI